LALRFFNLNTILILMQVQSQPARKPLAVVIGDINIDIITPPVGSHLPETETSFIFDEFHMSLGGNAINVAATLAAMGSSHMFLGGIGDCAISDWIRKKCNQLKIHTELGKISGKTAGITFAITYTGGRRQFIATLGTNQHITMEQLSLQILEKATHLHRAGFWYTPQLKGEPTIRVMKQMIQAGQETSLDVGWDPENFSPSNQELLYKTLEYTSYFFANEKELKAITKKSVLESVYKEILGISTTIDNPVIIVHQGEKGCSIVTRKNLISIPPFPIKKLVNPTGSGDIFNGAFIHGLLQKWPLDKCAKIAGKAAAIHLEDISKIYPSISDIGSM
jgi:sugar/nucleoside kinase (ribokinase family)